MPYAPLGFQTPIPPQGQLYWDDPYGPPSPNSPLYDQAMNKAANLNDKIGNLNPVELATATLLPYGMGRFPRAASAALGAYWPMLPEWAFGQGAQKTQSQPQEQYKSQKTLRLEAEAAKAAAEAAKAKSDTEKAEKANDALRLQEEARKSQAAREEKARADAEVKAKRQAEEEALKIRREAGAAAEKEATQTLQNTPPSWVETYGPAAGTFGGLVIGKGMQGGLLPSFLGGKGGMQGKIRAAKEAEAARANQLVGDIEAGAGGAPGQQARMNQFVSEGGGTAPFPPGSATPMSPGPDFSKLYQSRTLAQNLGPGAVAGTIGGVEGYAGHGVESRGREELAAATAEFKRLAESGIGTGPEYTAAVQKLLAARQKVALGDMLFRMGVYTGIGAGAGEAQSRLTNMPRPDVGRAEGAYRTMTAPPAAPLSPGVMPGGGYAPPVGNIPLGAQPPPPRQVWRPGGPGGGGHWEEIP